MADLDNFLGGGGEDEAWESDNESVPQDPFNSTRFDKVAPMRDGEEKEAPVKGSKKVSMVELNYGYDVDKGKAPSMTSSTKAKPMASTNGAMKLEKAALAEDEEKEQARKMSSFKRSAVPPPKLSMVAANPAEPPAEPQLRKVSSTQGDGPAFSSRFSDEVVAFFSEINKKNITQQAIEYLNAYWAEVGDQAEFIFSVAIRIFREADMHRQGITLQYKYDEGADVDYPTYLYFYEKLVKFVTNNPEWKTGQYEKSAVYEVKTAVKHKNDLKEKVDVNFDGRISFLEFLLYQYNNFSNPADYMARAKAQEGEHPAIRDARLALDEVNARIKAYEEERARLQEGAKQPGVKGLTFKHQLTMLDKSPLSEKLNEALITAEAAVRMAVKKFSGSAYTGVGAKGVPQGALWWMQRDLEEKKRVVIPATLRRMKKSK